MSRKEAVVARLDELKDGEMKEVSAGETKVLLARYVTRCSGSSPFPYLRR